MADKDYEGEYHANLHEYLYKDAGYYELRAKLAYLNYFKGIDLKGKKILEFGCGLGQNIYYLSKKGADIKGFDVSKFAIEFCRKKGIATTNNLKKEKKFDVIFSRHVLEHIQNPFGTLRELREKLNENGKLILILPSEKNEKVSFKPDKSRHLYCWTFRTINNLLDEAGYRAIENKVLTFAMGYNKLRFANKMSTGLYDTLTKAVGRMRGAKELKIVAVRK